MYEIVRLAMIRLSGLCTNIKIKRRRKKMRSKEKIMRDIVNAHNDGNTEVVSPRVEASVLIETLIDIRDQLEQLNTIVGNWANIEINRTR